MSNNYEANRYYERLNSIYESALARSDWHNPLGTNPAEELVLKIADLANRCSKQGPNPIYNEQRAELAVAVSYFLYEHFEVGSHWDDFEQIIGYKVMLDIFCLQEKEIIREQQATNLRPVHKMDSISS